MNSEKILQEETQAKQEKDLYESWEKAGYFKPKSQGNSFCIMLPPPNVTGSLHMGHAFQQTLMDILIRYHRMMGDRTLWQGGTDHAGIATQMMVERQLSAQGISRTSLGREGFVEKVWEWKRNSGNSITQQMRRLGVSIDWSRERFTLDEGLSEAVQEVFIRLYDEGLIYRGTRLVNWDPVLLTAVSDLEVESEETKGSLWYIRYPLADKNEAKKANNLPEFVIVATTRPETLLGDVAVAVNPEDPRYAKLIGKMLKLPLTERLIPIIADDQVSMEFGTGAVKITPAHDFNDYAMAERHQLSKINIFTEDAKLNTEAPKAYQGLDRFVARKKIVEDLKAQDLLEKIEDHTLNVPRGDRSGAVLEPRLTEQWYIKIEPLAKPATEVVEKQKVQFIPENWSKTYFEWMHNIQDWCISRQLWWGHRIPAWYDAKGNIYVGKSEAQVREKYQLSKDEILKQDEDVLDTWFSSALWPFSTLGWPKQTAELKDFYPTQVLITGFDIIFFWVARMIMFGLKFAHNIPFSDVYINGIIVDQDGQKMSKTKGNVLDPLDLIDGIDLESLVKKRKTGLMQPQLSERIEKNTRKLYPDGIPAFGTDALRFTFCSIATQSRYIRFDLKRIEGYRHFINKLKNAARYVEMNTEGKDLSGEKSYTVVDKWITSLWQKAKQDLHKHINEYRFDLAASTLYEFTWNEFCDWYLELSKPILTGSDVAPEFACGTRHTLLSILEELFRALHPIIPYLTEELWQKLPESIRFSENVQTSENIRGSEKIQSKPDSIMIASYPLPENAKINLHAENDVAWLKAFVLAIRGIRGEMQVSPAKSLSVILEPIASNLEVELDQKRFKEYEHLLKALAKISEFTWVSPEAHKPMGSTAIVDNVKITIPFSEEDREKEVSRLEKETKKLLDEINQIRSKLENDNFVKKAPNEVVEQERKRLTEKEIALNNNRKEIEKLKDCEKQKVG